jgi:hypothetical protein
MIATKMNVAGTIHLARIMIFSIAIPQKPGNPAWPLAKISSLDAEPPPPLARHI